MEPMSFCDFFVSEPDREPGAGFLQDSAGCHHRGRISGRDLNLAVPRWMFFAALCLLVIAAAIILPRQIEVPVARAN
jgi:hypothetical protein